MAQSLLLRHHYRIDNFFLSPSVYPRMSIPIKCLSEMIFQRLSPLLCRYWSWFGRANVLTTLWRPRRTMPLGLESILGENRLVEGSHYEENPTASFSWTEACWFLWCLNKLSYVADEDLDQKRHMTVHNERQHFIDVKTSSISPLIGHDGLAVRPL